MEKWWKEHANVHNDPEWVMWVSVFSDLLVKKQTEWTQEHKNVDDENNKVFGMSKASGCTRSSALKLLGYKPEPVSGSTNFTFWLGHAVEIAALATLEVIGYHLENTQAEMKLTGNLGKETVTLMQSASDGIVKVLNAPTIVSVKSAAYKMSGQRQGKWIRNGFAELPFLGVRKSQPSWYAQAQSEMAASGIKQTLFIVAAKDIVKAFENDEYLGERGNGSLTFYAEICKFEPEVADLIISTHEKQLSLVREGKAGPALYMTNAYQYVELEKANVQSSNIWGGKNKEITGSFNPCGGCQLVEACKNAT